MNKKETVNVVPAIEKILSGTTLDEPTTETPKTKVDGRSKEYKSTVKRVAEGGRRKNGEGLDARSKSFKDTFARISAKTERKTENEPKTDDAKEEPQVEEGWYGKGKKKKKNGKKKEMKEMFSDVDFLIDQLTNMMEHLDKSEFIDVVSTEVKGVSSKTAQKMFEDYWKLSNKDRKDYSISDWKDWLMEYGIRESVNEEETEVSELQYQDTPKYRGGASVVRGGLAMNDERLGKMRIMMRNIAKFEGVDALADEICDALDRSDGMKLAQAIIKKKKSY